MRSFRSPLGSLQHTGNLIAFRLPATAASPCQAAEGERILTSAAPSTCLPKNSNGSVCAVALPRYAKESDAAAVVCAIRHWIAAAPKTSLSWRIVVQGQTLDVSLQKASPTRGRKSPGSVARLPLPITARNAHWQQYRDRPLFPVDSYRGAGAAASMRRPLGLAPPKLGC